MSMLSEYFIASVSNREYFLLHRDSVMPLCSYRYDRRNSLERRYLRRDDRNVTRALVVCNLLRSFKAIIFAMMPAVTLLVDDDSIT